VRVICPILFGFAFDRWCRRVLALVQCREHGLRRKTKGAPPVWKAGAKYFGVERRGARAAPLRSEANRQHKGKVPWAPSRDFDCAFLATGFGARRIGAPKTKGPTWDDPGVSIVEHLAGVDDFEVAEATYRAAVARWPRARITLRQGIRVVHDTG
jgi:hypothetical protein